MTSENPLILCYVAYFSNKIVSDMLAVFIEIIQKKKEKRKKEKEKKAGYFHAT